MTTRFLLALLSATTLIPATAMAQAEPEGRPQRGRERIERMGGESPGARAEFGGGVRVQAPAPRPERPRGDDGAPRQDRGDWQRGDHGDRGNGQRPEQPRPDRGEWQQRPQPGRPVVEQRRDPPRDAQGQIDREQLRRQWEATRRDGGRDDDRQRDAQRRDDWQRDRARTDQRQRDDQWQRDAQRREWERDRGQRDRGDGGWSRSGSDRRDNDRYQYDRNDRQQWNRNWRGDRRYDWNRYRDANRGLYRLPRYYAPQGYGYGYRRFGVGVTLNSFLFGQNYWINDPFSYRLPEAYGPYRWVRYYNDALLVDVRSGRVVDVEYDIFW